jgi:hypothetical protein
LSFPDDPPQAVGVSVTTMVLAKLGAVFNHIAAALLKLTAQLDVDVGLPLQLVFN